MVEVGGAGPAVDPDLVIDAGEPVADGADREIQAFVPVVVGV
jgi:hypothetical protein